MKSNLFFFSMPRFFLSGQGFKMRKFCTISLFFLNLWSANFGFSYFFKPNFRPKNCSFLPKFSSEIVLIWFQKMLFSVFAQRKGLVVRWGNWNSSARTSADIKTCCWITYQCLKGFRQPKQKYNKVTDVQSLTSAPLATNPCWVPYFSHVDWKV